MFKCVVGLFGLPHGITGEHKVEVELKDEASLTDVIAALRRELPKLEGPVIRAGEDKLTDHYAFNINGHFYTDDKEIRIRSGDKVALLALAAGGWLLNLEFEKAALLRDRIIELRKDEELLSPLIRFQ